MNPLIRSLLILQDKDRRIISLEKETANIPKEKERIILKFKSDKKALESAKEQLQQAELKVKKIELDVQTRKTSIERLKKQQFETRKNDEFQAIGHEIKRYEQDIDTLETSELEALELVDIAKQAVAKQDAQYLIIQQQAQQLLEQLKEKNTNLLSALSESKSERPQLAQDIPPDVLKTYDRLIQFKSGLAVVALEHGKCQGCHIKLISSTVIDVQKGEGLTLCEDCGRILYEA